MNYYFQHDINLDNSKIFYSRFLIPKKSRIDLVPINLFGKIDLESYEIKLDKKDVKVFRTCLQVDVLKAKLI